MPPKSRKVIKKPITTIQTFPTAFAELCGHIKKGPSTANGLIKAYKGLGWLREFLRGHRNKSTTIEVKFMEELVPILETAVCRRVDSLIFSTIIEIILQTDYCTRCERALYLLSVSLNESTKQEATKKIEIGLHCFNLLLARFVDDSHATSLRRWIGVLCTQLLRDTPENCDRLRLSPENTKRKIGELVTGKANEIIRYVCGGLIRELQNENVLLDELWPLGSSKRLYEHFPEATQLKTGWSQKFDAYLDLVVDTLESDPVRLYSAYECRLEPNNTFVARRHTIHFFCYTSQITIKLSCLDNAVDQMLDIPTCCISNMMIASNGSPNREQVWVIFEISQDETNSCFLNGDSVVLERVKICGTHEMAKGMRDDFASVCDIDGQEMLSTGSVSQRSILELNNNQSNNQLASLTGMYGTTPRLECFSSEIVLTGEGNENAPEEIAYLSEESASADGRIDNLPEIEAPELTTMDGVEDIAADTQSREASFITNKSPRANGKFSPEQLSDDPREVVSNFELYQSSEGPERPGDEKDLYDASPQKKQSASAATALVKTTPAESSRHSPQLSKSQKSLPKKHIVKSKAKVPIRTSASTRKKRLISKEKRASIETRVMHNSLVSLEIDSLTSPDEHNMSTPKPQNASAITQEDAQASLTQRNSQKGKIQKKTQSTAKKPVSKLQPLETPDLKDKTGVDDIYEMPPDVEICMPVKPEASAVKTKAKKPIVYSSKASASKPPTSKTNSQPKRVLPGYDSKMKTLKVKLAQETKPGKPQLDKAEYSKVEVEGSTQTQDTKVTKCMEAAQKNLTRRSLAVKSSSTIIQGLTQPKENLSKFDDQSNQGLKDNIAPGEIPLKAPLPNSSMIDSQNDVEVMKVTDTKATDNKSSRTTNNVINRASEKSGKGFATGLSDFLSDFDDIDSNMGPVDSSNIQYKIPEIVDSLMVAKEPIEKDAVNHAPHTVQAVENDAAKVEAVISASLLDFVLSSGRSNSSKKRKANMAVELENNYEKRKRIETSRLSTPRRSPRLQSHHHDTAARLDTQGDIQDKIQDELVHQPEIGQRPEENAAIVASIRLSSRFQAEKLRDDKRPDLTLLDDSVHRKAKMIHFSKQGPVNQGRLNRTPRAALLTTSQSRHPKQKRKLQASEGVDVKSPPRKKQHSSPIEPQADVFLPDSQPYIEVQNDRLRSPIEPTENGPIGQSISVAADHHITISDSSPEPVQASRVNVLDGSKAKRKTSSQGSRVAANGSPLPVLSIQRMNHIKKIKKNLREQTAMGAVAESAEDRAKSGTHVFGPRVRLESKLKARPDSPEKAEPRYVAHRKTKSGNYQGMATQEVIGPELALPDPFVDPTRKPSGFADRLRTSSGIQPEIDGIVKRIEAASVQKVHKTHRKSRPSNVFVDDAERTLVGEQSYDTQSEISLPSMSSGSSSGNSEARSPLRDVPNGMWNVALRPHYRNLKDAVHRVADEMLIRLSDEEETMGLVVDQYENNSSRLIDNMMMLRIEDKSSMVRGLLQRRSVMVQAYSKAVSSVTQSTTIIRESPVIVFEKDWKTAQNQIKEKIKEGRGT